MIKDVVTIDPELQSNALSLWRSSCRREVDLREIWTHEAVSSLVAERAGGGWAKAATLYQF